MIDFKPFDNAIKSIKECQDTNKHNLLGSVRDSEFNISVLITK